VETGGCQHTAGYEEEAVEINCWDPADAESEDAPAERAFALRMRALPTMG
jgi:hypothetical protein